MIFFKNKTTFQCENLLSRINSVLSAGDEDFPSFENLPKEVSDFFGELDLCVETDNAIECIIHDGKAWLLVNGIVSVNIDDGDEVDISDLSDVCSGCQYDAESIPLRGGSFGAYCERCRKQMLEVIEGRPGINPHYLIHSDASCTLENFLDRDRGSLKLGDFKRFLRIEK